ncbi:MAG: hypothetical protein BWZ10_01381 [candidate division BRC1 bacterium ADurb.BinA364]|nr:MAG: hypothetical protein BWZ10_01381 [candidate division BRC1 bacterium ADurb.BinA364]
MLNPAESEPGALFLHAPGYAREIIRPDERSMFANAQGFLFAALEPGASLETSLRIDGKPFLGAKASLSYLSSEEPYSLGEPAAAENGRARWDDLAAGRYRIAFSGLDERFGAPRLTRELELKAGEAQTLDVDFSPESGALFGRATIGGEPLSGAVLSLSPDFPSDTRLYGAVSGPDGMYRIEGLADGAYLASAHKQIAGGDSLILSRRVEIRGETQCDFLFLPKSHVTVRIEFPSSLSRLERSNYKQAYLRPASFLKRRDASDPEQLTLNASSPISAAGEARFEGRFRGRYVLAVNCEGGGEVQRLAWPVPFDLDNLSGGQDLGTLALPASGELRIRLALESSASPAPRDLRLLLFHGPARDFISDAYISPEDTDIVIGPIAAGVYEAALYSRAFHPAPLYAAARVEAGATTSLSFSLRRDLRIAGKIRDAYSLARAPRVQSVLLEGPGGRRMLQPSPVGRIDPWRMTLAGRDYLSGDGFLFSGLREGVYRLTVAADGYSTQTVAAETRYAAVDSPDTVIKLLPLAEAANPAAAASAE